MRVTIEIKKGKKLSGKYIDLMNKQRIKEYGENTKDFKKNELESIFFFVKDNKSIVSFGMLKPIKINYLGKEYNIFGIGNILSIKKGKGYGKILVNSMLCYLKKKRKTGLGFCGRKNIKFYEKSGLKTKKDLNNRFKHKYYDPEDGDGGDGVYYNSKDNFIKKILSTKSTVYIDIPFW